MIDLHLSATSSKRADDVVHALVETPGCKPPCVDEAEDVDIAEVALKVVKQIIDRWLVNDPRWLAFPKVWGAVWQIRAHDCARRLGIEAAHVETLAGELEDAAASRRAEQEEVAAIRGHSELRAQRGVAVYARRFARSRIVRRSCTERIAQNDAFI